MNAFNPVHVWNIPIADEQNSIILLLQNDCNDRGLKKISFTPNEIQNYEQTSKTKWDSRNIVYKKETSFSSRCVYCFKAALYGFLGLFSTKYKKCYRDHLEAWKLIKAPYIISFGAPPNSNSTPPKKPKKVLPSIKDICSESIAFKMILINHREGDIDEIIYSHKAIKKLSDISKKPQFDQADAGYLKAMYDFYVLDKAELKSEIPHEQCKLIYPLLIEIIKKRDTEIKSFGFELSQDLEQLVKIAQANR